MINAVLATDMANHFSDLGKLKSKLQTDDFLVGIVIHKVDRRKEHFNISAVVLQCNLMPFQNIQVDHNKEDRMLMTAIVVHASDISNPAKVFFSQLF